MAARFFVVGGVDTKWSTIGNWSLTTGGAGGQAVPAATDAVTFDGSSGSACVLDTGVNKVAASLVTTNYTGSLTFNVQLSVSGSITIGTNTTFRGTTTNKLRQIAPGTWTTNGVTIPQDLEIGGTTTFTSTLADALHTSGAFLLSNTTSTPFSGAFDITVDGNATVQGSQTVTLTGNIIVAGLTTISDANVFNTSTSKEWRTASITVSGALTGTATVVLNGTGTWTGTSAISNSLTITGTVTLAAGNNLYAASGTPTLTATSGTLAGSGVLSIGSSCTILGGSWPGITLTAALTLTINSLVTVTGTLTMPNAAVTFAGSAGWTVGTFTNTTITASRTWTFTAARTYTTTTAFDLVSAAAQTVRFILTSSDGTTKAIINLGPGCVQDLGFCDPVRIDSSGGQTVFSYHGVLTTCLNWIVVYPVNAALTDPSYQLGM